jgi:hypothetical protein
MGIIVTGGKFPPVLLTLVANLLPVSLTPVANLPPVSTTPAKLIAKLVAGVVDMVVHLDLQISPRICKQIRNCPNGVLWGWGDWPMKKPDEQNL